MFHSARLRLTAWYLVIIMIISTLFSVVIYLSVNQELTRFENYQRERQERFERIIRDMPVHPPGDILYFTIVDVDDARKRVVLMLLLINFGILILSGGAGYFLAGRTLKPIQVMVDDQKRFVADASHELRTPLTALRSEIEVNLRDPKLTASDAKKLLKSNLEEVTHLQNLSDGLIALTKQQSTKQVFASVTLLTALEQALKKVTPLAKNKKISIQVTGNDLELWGNEETLTKLFVILLDNAIKYSPKETTITINSKTSKHNAVISVSDQGMGIAKKDLPHIFDRFYRADQARSKDETDGYGLGLSIAEKIVSDHNGVISATSKLGKGTTFVITLPV